MAATAPTGKPNGRNPRGPDPVAVVRARVSFPPAPANSSTPDDLITLAASSGLCCDPGPGDDPPGGGGDDPCGYYTCDDGNPCTSDWCNLNPSGGYQCDHMASYPPGVDCCNMKCCGGVQHCNDVCCPPGEICCLDTCCMEPEPPAPCCGAVAGLTCCGSSCCWGVCINDTECCLAGKACPAPGGSGGEICCDPCDSCSGTGCCPGAVCSDGLCCGDGDPCTQDKCECADSNCESQTCSHPPLCDDGNTCTTDVCTPGGCNEAPTCSAQCLEECADCPYWLCDDCVCKSVSCSFGLDSGTGCPGSRVELTLTGHCDPGCNKMSFSMEKSVQYLTVNLPGSIPCDRTSYERTFTVDIDSDAPPGWIVFELLGTTPEAECSDLTSARVTISATLTLSPSSISANTTWTGMPSNSSRSDITVTWDPPECVGTLEIVDLEPQQPFGYLPADDGLLTPDPDTANLWHYTAFDEPQSELCPAMVKVWIAAFKGDVELTRRSILVWPVHGFFITGANANFRVVYGYIVWKYATVLATTGGAFAGSPDHHAAV